jgi:hypothetical protein
MASPRPRVLLWLIPIGFVIAALAVLWHGLVTMPREYHDLATRGTPVRVQITSCGPGVGGDSHGYGCRLRTDYEGHVHRWRVDRDVRAEAGPDGAADGLVDPVQPGRSALVRDVDHRSSVPDKALFVGGFFGVMAVLTAGAAAWTRRRAQNPV